MVACQKSIKLVINCISTAVGIALLFSGIFHILHIQEENRCDMTYMFEYPEYIPVPLNAGIKRKFPKYTLMLYGEGNYAAALHRHPPSGIPVLFIPGNAGSHKQVRSLGSVALRKTEGMRFHFNFFTVDFKEELTALRGSYLWSQTKFVHECIKVILGLYEESNAHNQSLVIIGHSMGGVIARGLFTLQDFDRNSVNTIIALATPNLRPPVMVDQEILTYYSGLNALWSSSNHTERDSMMHLIFVSIGGGNRDMQVHSHLIPLGASYLASQSFSVIASAIPKVWLSTDHRCIVWCKQLVLAITRALIDLVDGSNYKVANSARKRLEILQYHLFSSFSLENSLIAAKNMLLSDSKVDISSCKVIANRQYFQSSPKLERTCFLFNITEEMTDLHVIYTGTLVDWIGECESAAKCEFYSSNVKKAEIIPAKNGLIKVITINLEKSFDRSRIIYLRLNNPKTERLYTKITYKRNDTIDIRNQLGFAKRGLYVSNERTFLSFELPFMRVPWFSYQLFIHATCKQHDSSISAKLQIPWLKEDILRVFDKSLELKLTFNIEPPVGSRYQMHAVFAALLGMFRNPPAVMMTSPEETPELLLWFDSKCDFDVKAYFDFVGTTGQLLKFSYEKILRWVAVFSLLNLGTESGILIDQLWHYSAYLSTLVLFSICNLQILCLEGLAVIFFDIIVAYGIVSILYILAQLLITLSKQIGNFLLWMSSFPRKFTKSCHSTDKISLNFYLFYGELLLLFGLQFVASSGLAIIVFVAICTFTGLLARKKPTALSLIALEICLRLPKMVTWLKDMQEGYPTDVDLSSSVTSFLLVIGLQVISHCQDKRIVTSSFVYNATMYAFSCFLLSSSISFSVISQLLTMAVAVYCLIYKQSRITL